MVKIGMMQFGGEIWQTGQQIFLRYGIVDVYGAPALSAISAEESRGVTLGFKPNTVWHPWDSQDGLTPAQTEMYQREWIARYGPLPDNTAPAPQAVAANAELIAMRVAEKTAWVASQQPDAAWDKAVELDKTIAAGEQRTGASFMFLGQDGTPYFGSDKVAVTKTDASGIVTVNAETVQQILADKASNAVTTAKDTIKSSGMYILALAAVICVVVLMWRKR